MIEPKLISTPKYESKSMQYNFLRQLGVEWIQRISGNKWTDYNYHDPGITFLEQLCYALTDLGYRTNFPIQDLLLTSDDEFDLEKYNLLIPAHKIFPSAPLNLADYRKIIIQQIPNIKNAWIQPVEDNTFGFNGIFNVLIQCDEEIIDNKLEDIQSEVHQLLMQNRSLSTDFQSINILKKDNISISAKISIDSFILGESVLAEVYQKIEIAINPSVTFYDYEDMINKGYTALDLYTGPPTQNGFIDFKELKGKTNEIYISEIKELIENTEGVISVDKIDVFKNGIRIFEDLISFGENNYPSLEKNIQNYNTAADKMVFYRNNNIYEIDTVILSQLYDAQSVASKNNFFNPKHLNVKSFTSRFTKEEMEHYFSIQNELPSIYGLKENELSSSVPNKRKAQAKQLKAYLAIFEQIMSSHLSQTVNIRNIFSIQKEIDQTYFTQLPKSIPELKSVIKEKNILDYEKKIQQLTESEDKKFIRRNHILNHLISRFGESLNTSLLKKLTQSLDEELKEIDIQKNVLNKKIDFAEQIVDLGKNRIRSFNYNLPSWDHENISGLEKRLKLTLGIQDHSVRSLVSPILDYYTNTENEDQWDIKQLQILKGPKINVTTKTKGIYTEDEVLFHCPNLSYFKSLFIFAHKSKSYRVLPSKIKNKVVYNLLYNTPNQEYPTIIFQSSEEDDCIEKLASTKDRFKSLNNVCEGIFLIEHILLRPLVSSNYTTSFVYNDGSEFLKSYTSGTFEDQREFRDDIYVLGVNSENYSVQKIKNKSSYKVILFDILNQPIFESIKIYNSKGEAMRKIEKIIAFFEEKKKKQIDLDKFSAITIDMGNSHEFPVDFEYSNTISVIIPNWPFRFQNNEFMGYLNKLMDKFIPAHIKCNVYPLDINQIALFEDTYLNWLKSKMNQKNDVSDTLSLQLIQLLKSYKSQN